MDRPFKGIWIPAEIWLDEKLTVTEKVLYAEIDSFCSKGRECFCSNAHFAKVLQVSERQVRRLLCSLEEKGFIGRRVVYKEGSKEVDKRYLKAVPPKPFDTTPMDINVPTPTDMGVRTPGEENVPTPGGENVLDTNPYITKDDNDDDKDWLETLKFYQNEINPAMGGWELERLGDLYDSFGSKWVVDAMKEAIERNARSLKYITAVLEQWQRDGYKVDKRKKKGNQPSKKKANYSQDDFDKARAEMERRLNNAGDSENLRASG
jgi:DnaD/phage-associated family protein